MALDLDTVNIYPNDQFDNSAEMADTFVTVGALNFEYGSDVVAEIFKLWKNKRGCICARS